MKTTKQIIVIVAMFLSAAAFAQKPSVAVLNIDSKGLIQDSKTMGYLVRLELEKTGVYSVMDKYEIADVVAKNKIDADNCYSKSCLVETGKLLGVDKMISGSAERIDEKIVITLRLIDVKSGSIEKTDATEYLNLPEVQKMVEISVKKIAGVTPDQAMVDQLIDYDVPIQSPKNTLRLNGPRMGFSYTGGNAGKLLQAPTNKGGFDMFPVTFDFGWQQEFQYISAGNFQALIENVFLIGGLESGRFIPSYTPLMGFRFGKGAWEFGFGPTFRFVKRADGYYTKDDNGDAEWHLKNEWNGTKDTVVNGNPTQYAVPNPNEIVSRVDSRGHLALSTGLVLAVGKTFHSGYLNIPVNIFIAPRRDGTSIGATFGFNIQKKKSIK